METATESMSIKRKSGLKRVLGEYDQGKVGATIICFCSIHGNEPAGKIAFERVLEELKKHKPDFRGRIVGLLGNIAAISAHERFIDTDLNRVWTEERVRLLQSDYEGFPEDEVEDREQKQLWKVLNEEIKRAQDPIVFLDLHTTSSKSHAFISINDTLKNRYFALKYPLPIILGLEEHLEGTILSYINELGHVAIGIEGGQHDDIASVKNHESMIWSTLAFTHCVTSIDVPNLKNHYNSLVKDSVDGQTIFEVRYRHAIRNTESFSMKPGYVNFQPIHKNEMMALHNEAEVKSPERGRIFMPLYQQKGNDGFFVIRKIRKFWLGVSAFLRQINFHRFIQYLPGVSKYQEKDHTIVVNRRIARWYVIELFHLLGFRRKIGEGNKIVFIRRPIDL